jgi:amidophosphoribosyltransferase
MPMLSEYKGRKVAVSFNGNLPDEQRDILRSRIPAELLKPRDKSFDSNDIADALSSAPGRDPVVYIQNAMRGIQGAYSLTILTDQGRLFGLRGPSGTWPLWVGEGRDKIVMASETRVEKALDEKVFWRQVRPGELVEATSEGIVSRQIFEEGPERICSLHAVYGAKADSLMREGLTYGEFRKEMGRRLARQHPIEADIYVGVPDGGLDIADGYAEELGKTASRFIKKKDNLRSYIAKSRKEAADIVSRKYEDMNREDFEGKSAVVLDDTIIKSLTLGGDKQNNVKGIIQMVRDAGATRVDAVVILQKFKRGCQIGYVIIEDQLVAIEQLPDGSVREVSDEEIAGKMGADSVTYATYETMKEGFDHALQKENAFCYSCMGGPNPLEVTLYEAEVDLTEEVLIS